MFTTKHAMQPTPIPRQFDALPNEGYVRQAQLILSGKNQSAPLPFAASTLWRKVKAGEFPSPVKLGGRTTAWRVSDVRRWLAQQQEVSA